MWSNPNRSYNEHRVLLRRRFVGVFRDCSGLLQVISSLWQNKSNPLQVVGSCLVFVRRTVKGRSSWDAVCAGVRGHVRRNMASLSVWSSVIWRERRTMEQRPPPCLRPCLLTPSTGLIRHYRLPLPRLVHRNQLLEPASCILNPRIYILSQLCFFVALLFIAYVLKRKYYSSSNLNKISSARWKWLCAEKKIIVFVKHEKCNTFR